MMQRHSDAPAACCATGGFVLMLIAIVMVTIGILLMIFGWTGYDPDNFCTGVLRYISRFTYMSDKKGCNFSFL